MRTFHQAGLILTALMLCWSGAGALPIPTIASPVTGAANAEELPDSEPMASGTAQMRRPIRDAMLAEIEPLKAFDLLPSSRGGEVQGYLPEPKPLLLFATGFIGLAIGIHIKRKM